MLIDPAVLDGIVKWLGAGVVGLGAYVWRGMDARVSKLEENMASKEDVREVKDDVRGLYNKLDDVKDTVIDALKAR